MIRLRLPLFSAVLLTLFAKCTHVRCRDIMRCFFPVQGTHDMVEASIGTNSVYVSVTFFVDCVGGQAKSEQKASSMILSTGGF